MFTNEEIFGGRFYDRDSEITVTSTDPEWASFGGLARIVVLHALEVVAMIGSVDIPHDVKFEMVCHDLAPSFTLLDVQFLNCERVE